MSLVIQTLDMTNFTSMLKNTLACFDFVHNGQIHLFKLQQRVHFSKHDARRESAILAHPYIC